LTPTLNQGDTATDGYRLRSVIAPSGLRCVVLSIFFYDGERGTIGKIGRYSHRGTRRWPLWRMAEFRSVATGH